MTETYTDLVARKMRLEGLQYRIAISDYMLKSWNIHIAELQQDIVECQQRRDYWLRDVEQAKEEMRNIAEGVEP